MKPGDRVIVNGRIKSYSAKIPEGRAEVVRVGEEHHDSMHWVQIRLDGKEFITTVPSFSLDPITVLDKIYEAMARPNG
jgi:hypothetical protein